MKQELHNPPREFSPYPGITLHDMGDIWLDPDQQLTIRTPSGSGNDVVRKDWGFYLTNSLNVSLRSQGLKTALVASGTEDPRLYILMVENGKLDVFNAYLAQYGMKLIMWLDEYLARESKTANNGGV